MSWFLLSDIKERKKLKGIWLRKRADANVDVFAEIKRSKNLRLSETVWKIEIVELRKENTVLLEVWAQSFVDVAIGKERHNVFHILIKENPNWVCEGDLGRGSENY